MLWYAVAASLALNYFGIVAYFDNKKLKAQMARLSEVTYDKEAFKVEVDPSGDVEILKAN